jgi:tripartite-type tricarboxylate transporter receptor subunit TctC
MVSRTRSRGPHCRQAGFLRARKLPDMKARLGELGYDPIGSTPEEFATRIKVEIENWAKVIRAANIKVE